MANATASAERLQSQVDQLRLALTNEQHSKDELKRERDAAKDEAEKVFFLWFGFLF
jgi:uncharacterized protein (DUF3084 family)